MFTALETADIIRDAREALFEQVDPGVARLEDEWDLLHAAWLDDAHDAFSAEGHMTREAQARGVDFPDHAVKAVRFAQAIRKLNSAYERALEAAHVDLDGGGE